MYTEVEIPEGVEVVKEVHDLVVRGKLGELRRTFLHPHINVEVKDDKVVFSSDRDTRKEKRVMNTFAAHLRNMIKGVTKGYV
ncbi:MAG: 50S ribosomal protein L6, partial [Nanoarchaeota archaeon]|nr:50S ribosomal protein L6 [Nanoarchaeota archaeon]